MVVERWWFHDGGFTTVADQARVFWTPGDNPICAVPTFLHFDSSSDPIDVLLKSGPEFGHEQVRAAGLAKLQGDPCC